MRKLPFFTGLAMLIIQSLILGVYFLSQRNIPVDAWNFGIVLVMLVPTNIVAISLFLYGLLSKEE